MKTILVLSLAGFVPVAVFGDTTINAWIKPTSGNWEEQSSWSLGALPSQSQSVYITNSGWKAVAIGGNTAQNFPQSMTVDDLTIRGAFDTENVLLLNYAGTAIPLTVLNGLTLQDMVQLVNLNSGLVVQGGTITVTNAQIFQDGGFVRTTNTTMYLQNAEYDLTNGVFEAGQVVLGLPVSARFNQYAGAVVIANLAFGEGPTGAGGAYALYGGYLSLPGGLALIGGGGAYSSYFQSGGTNQTTSIYLEPNMYGSSPSFTLNGGLLASANVSIVADDYGDLTLNQNGGTHIITNTLSISGGFTHGETIRPGTYNLNGGTLSAGAINLNANPGDAVFVQSNGTTSAGTVYAHSAGYFASCNTHITLAGGTLSCSNLTTDDGHGTLDQSGGALLVSDLLDLHGFRDLGMGYTYYFRYTFTGGTLTANNISIAGDWIIGDSTGANRITNSGTCTLSHTIQIGNAVEQLGRFILATNATIDLAGSSSRLSFDNSSGQAWASGATLTVSNWNGSLSGGGAEQLKFGTSASGLTSAQLSQILFNNPAGLSAGAYTAKILSTGEIVPDASITPPPGLVNNWLNSSSDKWEDSSSWSLGILPASNQTVNITNLGYKAVNIDSATVSGFSNSLTVSNLTLGLAPNSQNVLLLNYAGTTTPLRVLNNLNVETNGRVLMLYSGMNASNAVHVGGVFDQEGGQFTFTNSPATTMQVEGGSFNLTNGFVSGANMYLGGTNDGYVNQDSGLVSLNSLALGSKLSSPNDRTGSYLLQSGWLIVGGGEDVGESGSGTLTQNGGTNSANEISVGYGTYTKNGGSLFAGDLLLAPPSGPLPPSAMMTHAGGISLITNNLHLFSPGSGPHNGVATFNITAGTLSAQNIQLEDSSIVNQSNATVNAAGEVVLNGSGGSSSYAEYHLSGGSLSTSNVIILFQGDMLQTGGTLTVTNALSISSQYAFYSLNAGTLTARNITLAGNLNSIPPPLFELYNTPPFAVTNENTSIQGGVIAIANSTQQLGQLILLADSGVSFSGTSAVLRFADSHTNSWQSGSQGAAPQLQVAGWNGSTNGGGTDQLIFGTSTSALTPGQVAQIYFINPASFPSGTYPARILSTGEVVPAASSRPTLEFISSGGALNLSWGSGWILQSATNVSGPYQDVSGATSPYAVPFSGPQRFFRLRD